MKCNPIGLGKVTGLGIVLGLAVVLVLAAASNSRRRTKTNQIQRVGKPYFRDRILFL